MKAISRSIALWSLMCLLSTTMFTACKHEPPVIPAGIDDGDDDDGDDDDDGFVPDTANVGS